MIGRALGLIVDIDLSVRHVRVVFSWLEAHSVIRVFIALVDSFAPVCLLTSPRNGFRVPGRPCKAADVVAGPVSEVVHILTEHKVGLLQILSHRIDLFLTNVALVGLGTLLTAGDLLLEAILMDEVCLLVIENGGVALVFSDVLLVFGEEFGRVGRRVIFWGVAESKVSLRQAQFLILDKLWVGRSVGAVTETLVDRVLVRLVVERSNLWGLWLLLQDIAGTDPGFEFPVLAASVSALRAVETRLLDRVVVHRALTVDPGSLAQQLLLGIDVKRLIFRRRWILNWGNRLRMKHASSRTADRDTARLHDTFFLVDFLLITKDLIAILG